jgi:transposase
VLRLKDEKDPEVLRKAALILEQENKRLVAQVLDLQRKLLKAQGKGGDTHELQLRLAQLEQQLDKRNRLLFGDSSEKRGGADDAKPRGKRTGHGPRPQPELPVVEQQHELDEADQVCPACGGQLHEWDGQTEDSDEIDVIERRFVVRRHKRKKYVCKCGGCVETAPGPTKLVEGGRYSVDFAIEVAIGKYLDHLPLERQVRIMRREGLEIDSQTLWNQLDTLAVVLRPAYARLLDFIVSRDVIGADETTWKLLAGKKGKRGSKTWQMWAVGCEDAVYYKIQQNRSLDSAIKLLGQYEGTVVCDGYQVYSALQKRYRCIELAQCWAHVRRKFVEAERAFPTECAEVLDMIQELYAIEKLCPTGPPGDEQRRKLRTERSAVVLQRIKQWAYDTVALPQGGLGQAVAYMLGAWEGLTRFLQDPRIPLDNNQLERSLRGPVVGRKNHYGSRSKRGTQVAAMLYSLIESAKLVGVEPKAYLRQATLAGLRDETVPLPHELVDSLAADTTDD